MAQRQFRSDDTDVWVDRYGDGSGGDVAVNTSTDAPIDSACTGTGGTTSLSATNASFAAGQLILIHQTKGTGAGQWELNKIASYSAGTITTAYNLINTYATGAQVIVLAKLNDFTVNSGQTLTAKAWDGSVGGIVARLGNGVCTITGNINGVDKGFRKGTTSADGAPGQQGESSTGNGTTSAAANGSGGGGGEDGDGAAAGGGGGGGHGATGTNGQPGGRGAGTGGSTDGGASLQDLNLGGAGGAGGKRQGSGGSGGVGGDGGAIVFLIFDTITVTGTIVVTGETGGAKVSSGSHGGGGGGAGGAILLKGKAITIGTNLISAGGGGGGAGNSGSNNNGGAGAVGRIHIDYGTSLSGSSSTPSADTTNDTSLSSTAHTKEVTDSVTLTETFRKATSKFFTNSMTITETVVKAVGKFFTNSMTATEIFLAARTFLKEYTDSVTITETFRRAITILRTESITAASTLARYMQRSFSDAITFVETFIKSPGKVFSNSISISEVFRRAMTILRSEAVTISEVFSRIYTKNLHLLDSITLTETFQMIFDKFGETFNWIKARFGPVKPTSTVMLDTPKQTIDEDRPDQMSSGEDTPTGSILEGDKPTMV